MQVYLHNDRLNYVVSVPPVNKEEFKAYHLVPVPISVNKDKLMYNTTPKSILWTKHGNTITLVPTLNYKNAEPTKQRCVCKQDKSLLSRLVQEECTV